MTSDRVLREALDERLVRAAVDDVDEELTSLFPRSVDRDNDAVRLEMILMVREPVSRRRRGGGGARYGDGERPTSTYSLIGSCEMCFAAAFSSIKISTAGVVAIANLGREVIHAIGLAIFCRDGLLGCSGGIRPLDDFGSFPLADFGSLGIGDAA